jgi:phosphoglycerate dehydrogenase-like enzyme
VIASPIADEAVAELSLHHDVQVSLHPPGRTSVSIDTDRECLILRSGIDINADVIDHLPDLSFIVRAGSGFDNIDLDYARQRRIRIVRIPGPAAQAVAEFTFGLMLSLARNITLADRQVRQGHWPKHQLGGNLLTEKTLGIVGAGNIGSRVGVLGAAWGMRVLGCVGHPAEVDTMWYAERSIELADIDKVIAEADYLTIHTPLDDTTRGLIGVREIAEMKQGAFLINTARSGVVDEPALHAALDSGHLAGAALDVHDREGEGVIPELAALDNVILTPHIGGMAIESQSAIGRRVIELVGAYLSGSLDETAEPAEIVL